MIAQQTSLLWPRSHQALVESQVLASLVGQVVFVVEAGKTPFTIVQEALEMIPEEKAIGMVLNKAESLSNRGSYYYSYYSAYGESDENYEDSGK